MGLVKMRINTMTSLRKQEMLSLLSLKVSFADFCIKMSKNDF